MRQPRRGCCEKHPHVRGENRPSVARKQFSFETPPRAWGKRSRNNGRVLSWRNTPTCVGKTLDLVPVLDEKEKHPHVRGENSRTVPPWISAGETPPRAWGKHPNACRAGIWYGNTPTCVGKTISSKGWKLRRRKHPHVRGENLSNATEPMSKPETPPRAWGKPGADASAVLIVRNTPTCVGKTVLSVVEYGIR